MPTAAERAQRIRAATMAARARMIAWREAQIEALQQLLEALAAELGVRIDQLADQNGVLNPSSIDALNQFIAQRMHAFDDDLVRLLRDGLAQSAAMGASVLGLLPVQADASAAAALRFVRAFTGADGLQLSDRLWRAGEGTRAALREQLLGAIARGQAASAAALDLIASGQPLLQDVQSGLSAARAPTLRDLVRRTLTAAENSQRFIYERLLRTEMNRAYTEAFVHAAQADANIAGVRFELSPLHPRPDICDLHAAANLHGLGPGVYPVAGHPYPAHPQTLSFLTYVFADEITQADRDGQQTAFDWIRAQPTPLQTAVLGGQRKQQAFAAGQLLPDELRSTWTVVRQRLGQ